MKDLGSNRFAVREKATRELAALGDVAEPVLRAALKEPLPLEALRRVEVVLRQVRARPQGAAWLRALRALEALEHAGTAEARQALTILVEQTQGTRLATKAASSLRRLAGQPAPNP